MARIGPEQLSGLHIGASVKVVDKNGWVHTGSLANVEHCSQIMRDGIKTMVVVRSADDSRWIGFIDGTVEVAS